LFLVPRSSFLFRGTRILHHWMPLYGGIRLRACRTTSLEGRN
jgi:hypothetical protein